MFERFTEQARQVIVLAQDEALGLRHNYIGTEHLLLGLVREQEGIAAGVLESLDITLEEMRAQIARIVGPGDEARSEQIPFTPRAKKVLELSVREARSLGYSYVDTEHILLGLVRENEGVAARILLDFDADAEKVRDAVLRVLTGPQLAKQDSPPNTPLSSEFADELDLWKVEGSYAPRSKTYASSSDRQILPVLVGWALFGIALSLGLLIGWLIWD